MNRLHLLWGILLLLVSSACSDDDYLDNSLPERNFFAVPEGETGEEAELRRTFFDKTDVYLLFNDTLGLREKATLSGEVWQDWQIVDLGYNMNVINSDTQDSLVYFYYSDIAKKKEAADFLEEILEDLNPLFYPYSIVALERIELNKNQWGEYLPPTDVAGVNGMQASFVALGDVVSLTEEEKERLKNEVMSILIIDRLAAIPEEEFEAFYEYTEEYYSGTGLLFPIMTIGFLETYYLLYNGTPWYTKPYDKMAYVKELFERTEVGFREDFLEYPICIAKMEIMLEILRKYGVNV